MGQRNVLTVDGIFTTGTLGARNYDVLPDGRLVVVTWAQDPSVDSRPPAMPQINVVLNWFDELNQRVSTR